MTTTNERSGNMAWFVVTGAGGKHICAACISVEDALRLMMGQTLYWQVVADTDEAWYLVCMLNSHAMTNVISPFNPQGYFGECHIHTLPHSMMPKYNPNNSMYDRISILSRKVAETILGIVRTDGVLQNSSNVLHTRRIKLRNMRAPLPKCQELERFCSVASDAVP